MGGNNKFIDKFSNVAMRVGGQIHLKALRDTFATIMPLYILAGVAVLINNVVLPLILKGNALVNAQYWGTVITNGTLNISGLLVAPIVAYMLSQSKRFENPLAAAIIALASLVVMMPNVLEVTPVGADKAVQVSGTIKKGQHKFIWSYLLIQLRKLLIYIRYPSDSYLWNIIGAITYCKYQREHACLCKPSGNSTYHERSIRTYIRNDRWIRKYNRIIDRNILIQ